MRLKGGSGERFGPSGLKNVEKKNVKGGGGFGWLLQWGLFKQVAKNTLLKCLPGSVPVRFLLYVVCCICFEDALDLMVALWVQPAL